MKDEINIYETKDNNKRISMPHDHWVWTNLKWGMCVIIALVVGFFLGFSF